MPSRIGYLSPLVCLASGLWASLPAGGAGGWTGARVPVAIGVWFLAAQLVAIPHGLRFGARLRDHLVVGLGLGLANVLPILPFLLPGRDRDSWYLVVAAWPIVWLRVAIAFRSAGRHRHADRDLPELEGEPRGAVDEILRRTGFEAAHVRVLPLATFNAMVFGPRAVVVLIDRRAADSLGRDELQALIAHEVGHARLGGVLPYLLAFSIATASFGLATSLGGAWATGLAAFLAILIAGRTVVSQTIELACDRFAARATSPGAVGRLLRAIHGDRPSALAAIEAARHVAPFLTHPPLAIRLAAVEGGARGLLLRHRLVRGTVLGALLGSAALLVLRDVLGIASAPIWGCLGWTILVGLTVACIQARAVFGRAARASFRVLLAHDRPRDRRWRVLGVLGLAAGAAVAAVVFPATVRLPGALRDSHSWVLLVGLLALVAIVAVRAMRALRLRRLLGRAAALLAESRPAEALEAIEASVRGSRVLAKRLEVTAWRGVCRLLVGRLEEARADLEEARRRRPRHLATAYHLATAELLLGKLDRAASLAAEVARAAPRDASGWELRALIALDAGDDAAAARSWSSALDLRPGSASAHAGLGLVSLAAGNLAEAEERIRRAAELERDRPFVRLAQACLEGRRGDPEASRAHLAKALDRLREAGQPGWGPWYERAATRWGAAGG